MAWCCAVPGCSVTWKSKVTMHRLPRRKNDSNLLREWLCAIARTDLIDHPKVLEKRICERHFSDEQKCTSTSQNETRLLRTAVPDINLPENLNSNASVLDDTESELIDWNKLIKDILLSWPYYVEDETTAFPCIVVIECVIGTVSDVELNDIPFKIEELGREGIDDGQVGDEKVNKIQVNQHRTSGTAVCESQRISTSKMSSRKLSVTH